MGGEERVARQHASGRLTVRERIERLFDEGSFRETGALAGRGSYEDGELTDQAQLRRIGLPVVDKLHQTLKFHAWFPGCPMEEDAYGIPKPKDTEVVVPTLLFVPRVGYSVGGFRLGYGGGFYDRTLAQLQPKPFTVGLGFAQGYLPDLEPEAHDVALDAILNELGVVWPNRIGG